MMIFLTGSKGFVGKNIINNLVLFNTCPNELDDVQGAMVKGIKNGYYFNIGGGKARKSMVLAEDIAEFILRVAPMGGIYNLTDGHHPSFRELSETIAKRTVFNLPLSVAQLLGKMGDHLRGRFPLDTARILKMTSDLTFDDTKARMVGWNTHRILEYLDNNDIRN